MARTLYSIDPNNTPEKLLGKCVYEPYTPVHCGIVINVETNDIPAKTLESGWVVPERREWILTWVDTHDVEHRSEFSRLQDYDALVEEHKHKYEKFSESQKVLRNLYAIHKAAEIAERLKKGAS